MNKETGLLQETISNVMGSVVDEFNKERMQTDSYKNLFKKVEGNDFRNMLRQLDFEMTDLVLDAALVIKQKTGVSVSNETYETLLALPYVLTKLEGIISEKEGNACCVDKAFYTLNKMVVAALRGDDE